MTDPTTIEATRDARRKRLRAFRESIPISQEKLGKLAGISRVRINKIENGADKMTRATTIGALAGAFCLTLDEFEGVLAGHVSETAMVSVAKWRMRRKAAAAAGEGVAK